MSSESLIYLNETDLLRSKINEFMIFARGLERAADVARSSIRKRTGSYFPDLPSGQPSPPRSYMRKNCPQPHIFLVFNKATSLSSTLLASITLIQRAFLRLFSTKHCEFYPPAHGLIPGW